MSSSKKREMKENAVVDVLESANDGRIRDLELQVSELKNIARGSPGVKYITRLDCENLAVFHIIGQTVDFERVGSMVKSSLLKMRYLASYGVSLAGHLYIQSVVWRSFMVFGSVYGHHDFRFVFIGLEVNKFEMSSFRWVVVHAGWLWVGLSLTGCVLAMWIFCLDEGASWYSVELMVPGSVLPFSKVTSSQIAAYSEWSLKNLDLWIRIPKAMHLRMSIDRLTESALIMDIGRLSPSAIILAQDLRKSSTIFYILAISCTIGTGLAAKVALVNWILIITKSKRRLHNLFTLVCISVVYLGLVGSVYYGATLKIDSAGFLPLVSEVVRLFCLTHQADQCKTRFVPLAGSIAFNGILIYLATIIAVTIWKEPPPLESPRYQALDLENVSPCHSWHSLTSDLKSRE